ESIRQLVSWLTNRDVFPSELYFLSRLPAEMDVGETTAVLVMALSLSLLATLYPSWRAARLDPVEALRYEWSSRCSRRTVVQREAGPYSNEAAEPNAPILSVRMDAVAALPAGAAPRGLHLGHRRLLVPRHHARRRHADHRDGGDERVSQGALE